MIGGESLEVSYGKPPAGRAFSMMFREVEARVLDGDLYVKGASFRPVFPLYFTAQPIDIEFDGFCVVEHAEYGCDPCHAILFLRRSEEYSVNNFTKVK